MEARHMEIRAKVDEAYAAIKKATEDLEVLRESCDHPETYKATYQWGGPGHNIPAVLCKACDKVISTAFDEVAFKQMADFKHFDDDAKEYNANEYNDKQKNK